MPGLLLIALVLAGVFLGSLWPRTILKRLAKENQRLTKQRDDLIESWQLILDHGGFKGEDQ